MLVRRMTAGRPAAVVLLTAVEPERLVPHLLEDTFRCTALLRVAPPRHALELHARRVDHALATGHAALLADDQLGIFIRPLAIDVFVHENGAAVRYDVLAGAAYHFG